MEYDDEMGGACSTHGRDEKSVQYCSWKIGRRKPLGRPTRGWKNNIKMYFKAMGYEGVDWIHLPQERDQWQALVNTVINLQVS
jgi:hypothetical protein